MNATGEPKSVVAVDLRTRSNARLLERLLGSRHQLRFDHDPVPESADLTIVDAATLWRHEQQIRRAREQASPVVLPVLLIAEQRDLRTGVIERHLGQTVDDVVRVPTTAAELRTRIENLLRLRRLSREQYARHQLTEQALRGTARALRALNAGNEVLVRVQREQELLDAICQIIIDEGRYPLAWAGFRSEADGAAESAIEVRSAAGRVEPPVTGTIEATGPIGRALATGEAEIVPDLAREPRAWPFEIARPDELASALILPIEPHMGGPGVLAIYSRAHGDFSDDERDLLERLAANVMLGVGAIRADQDRERQRTAIHELAFSDPLTGLSNRTHLVERLNQLLRDDGVERRLAILFVDLDHFKLVNDALGHVAGDDVLRQVGYRLANAVRAGDLVARQGGDEFIVVMSEEPRSDTNAARAAEPGPIARTARELASHIGHKLREPLVVHGYERRVGVSIGISVYPEHGQEAEALIDKADTAMYGAKVGGDSSRIAVYEPSMSHERRHRLSLEARLHRAVDGGELELCYQPMVELDSGRILGAEALLRWPQADGSFIAPGEFIPVAEETGLITGIGEWVLDTASRQIAEWRAQSLTIPVAVNISPRQIQLPGDQRRFADLVAAHVDPAWVELEVTENVLMANPQATESTLRAFTEQGFRLAVDDFGTGYSSLTRLQNLPIQTLKIDKAFVADLGRRRSGQGIVHSIIELARSLSMRPLAEGIETERQRDMLLDEGCRYGQGHWFSRPVAAAELAGLVRGRVAAPEPR